MQTSMPPMFLFVLLAGALALLAIVVAFCMRSSVRHSHVGFIMAVSPSFVMLTFFYSLAIHMHQSLGTWPNFIGVVGFPSALTMHGDLATKYFSILLLVSIFAWPLAFLLCLAVPRWSACLYYLGVYAFACLACFGAMLLAPSPFLRWWWD